MLASREYRARENALQPFGQLFVFHLLFRHLPLEQIRRLRPSRLLVVATVRAWVALSIPPVLTGSKGALSWGSGIVSKHVGNINQCMPSPINISFRIDYPGDSLLITDSYKAWFKRLYLHSDFFFNTVGHFINLVFHFLESLLPSGGLSLIIIIAMPRFPLPMNFQFLLVSIIDIACGLC